MFRRRLLECLCVSAALTWLACTTEPSEYVCFVAARAGDDQIVPYGTTARLDGAYSNGPDTFAQPTLLLIDRPTGSLLSQGDIALEFIPDVPGRYRIVFSITGRTRDSRATCTDADTVLVIATPLADANATEYRWDVGTEVTLDGTNSFGTNSLTEWTWHVLSHRNQIGQSWTPPDGEGITYTFLLGEPDSIEYMLNGVDITPEGSRIDSDTISIRSAPPEITDITPNSGAIGDIVTIDGSNFSPTASHLHNQVTFNGVVASFVNQTSASPTHLQVYVPANATTGPVEVEVLGTGDQAVGPTFTVTATSTRWESVPSGSNAILRSVAFADGALGMTVGEGAVLRTSDGGETWQPGTPIDAGFGTPHSVSYPAPALAVVGAHNLAGGTAHRSADAGDSWQDAPTGPGIPHLFFRSESLGWATGTDSIYKTEDGGRTWVGYAAPVRVGARAIFFTSDLSGFVVGATGSEGVILVTRDGGDTWSQVPQPSTDVLLDIWFSDPQNGFVIGRDATTGGTVLLETTNRGDTWDEVSHNLPSNLISSAVSFGTATTGTIVGYVPGGAPGGEIYRTVDGGSTWVGEEAAGLGSFQLLDVVMFDADRGIAVGQGGSILRRRP